MATKFKVRWGPYHQTDFAQFSPDDELDGTHNPNHYSLNLSDDVEHWCWTTECEVPELAVANWITHDGQEFPGNLELTFEDDALAQLFRFKWQKAGTVFE